MTQHIAELASMPAGSLGGFAADGVVLSTDLIAEAAVVTARGELDASNIHHLTDYLNRSLAGGRNVVLDLSRLEFLAAQGIAALFELDSECERMGITWAMLPSHPVTRLLRICGEEARLPVVSSIDEALKRLSQASKSRGLLQLVPKSG